MGNREWLPPEKQRNCDRCGTIISFTDSWEPAMYETKITMGACSVADYYLSGYNSPNAQFWEAHPAVTSFGYQRVDFHVGSDQYKLCSGCYHQLTRALGKFFEPLAEEKQSKMPLGDLEELQTMVRSENPEWHEQVNERWPGWSEWCNRRHMGLSYDEQTESD